MTDALVALSIDSTPSYAWLARRCVVSLRRTGTKLDVLVFAPRGSAVDLGDVQNVNLIEIESLHAESIYLDKWRCLAHLDAERVIFLDADTIGLQPLERLLEKYQVEDIYARQEAGTYRLEDQDVDQAFPAQIDWEAFDRQRDPRDATVPVVNTGVMILDHSVCRRIPQLVGDLQVTHADWASGARPYPSSNLHIREEVALSLALGRPGSPTLGCLSREDAPFYAELAGEHPGQGIVLHVWSGLYRRYLHEQRAWADLAEFDRERRRDRLQHIRARRNRDRAVA
jgi:hypothetical protein